MSTWRNTAVGAWAVAMSLIAGQSLANSDQTSSFTLGNGLEVVVIEDHRAPVVVQMLWYRAGAADETPGQSGVAHFSNICYSRPRKRLPQVSFQKPWPRMVAQTTHLPAMIIPPITSASPQTVCH